MWILLIHVVVITYKQEAKDSIIEMQSLQFNYNAEVKKQEALQLSLRDLQSGLYNQFQS